MIDEEKKKVILALYREGKKKKQIARLLNISHKTVRKYWHLNAGVIPRAQMRQEEMTLICSTGCIIAAMLCAAHA